MTDGEFWTSIWTGLGTVATGAGAWLIKWVWTRHKIRKSEGDSEFKREQRRSEEARTDMAGVVQGWQGIVGEMRSQIKALTSTMSQLRLDHTACEIKAAAQGAKISALESENHRLTSRIESLESDMRELQDRAS